MEAGLLPGDELIAIDGTRTASEDDIDRVMNSLWEDEKVEMLVARAGVFTRRTLVPVPDPDIAVTVRAEGDNLLRARWLKGLVDQ